jgi:hypothetical protein
VTLEQLDAELAAATANLRRLRDQAVAEFTAEAEAEVNPYTREFLLATVEKIRSLG